MAFRYYLFVIYLGGYDGFTKSQLKSCEFYDMHNDKWQYIADLNIQRSQSAACKLNDYEIFVFGGYNKEKGTLFMVVKVAKNLALILGGITKSSKESQKVFKYDYEKDEIIEMENLEKGGVIENEILFDNDDVLHIFLEHANGTSPHSHIKYYFDPKAP